MVCTSPNRVRQQKRLAEKRHSNITEELLNQSSKVTIKYITGVANVVLILIIINSIGLKIIGIQYAIMLGIISALFAHLIRRFVVNWLFFAVGTSQHQF